MQETQETQVRSLAWEDPLKNEMGTHSSILAWRIPWQRILEGYTVHILVVQMVGLEAPALPPPCLASSLQFSSLSLPGQSSGSSLSCCPPGEWIYSPSLQGSLISMSDSFFFLHCISVLLLRREGVRCWLVSLLKEFQGRDPPCVGSSLYFFLYIF